MEEPLGSHFAGRAAAPSLASVPALAAWSLCSPDLSKPQPPFFPSVEVNELMLTSRKVLVPTLASYSSLTPTRQIEGLWQVFLTGNFGSTMFQINTC